MASLDKSVKPPKPTPDWKPWRARVSWNGTSTFLGYFATKEEALKKECRFLEEMYYGDK